MAEAVIDRTKTTALLAEDRPLTTVELTQILRFLNRHCEDQDSKMRQLKSEIGRVARK
ncbi:MAG: hypothetical protein H0W78_16125 [Planctomycetes bacterium]|jgi:hypothetical protein|nr:hypothetical protein [Planctomycetota bacterium]